MAGVVVVILTLASAVPTLNLHTSCRGAASGAGGTDQVSAYKSCLHDEEAARKVLQQKWSQLPAAARTSCTDEATGISPSYVELLTCLEMRTGGNFTGGAAASVPSPPSGSTPLNPIRPATPNQGPVSSSPSSPVPGSTAPNASVDRALAPPPLSAGSRK